MTLKSLAMERHDDVVLTLDLKIQGLQGGSLKRPARCYRNRRIHGRTSICAAETSALVVGERNCRNRMRERHPRADGAPGFSG